MPPPSSYFTSANAPYQQDRYLIHTTPHTTLLAVADGHGAPQTGHLVSEHIVQTLPTLLHSYSLLNPPLNHDALRHAFAKLDASSIHVTSQRRVYAGSTLCMALVDLVNAQITVANVGDSRAIVVRRRDNAQRTRRRVPALRPVSESRRGEQFVQISTDHVCENEHEKLRILKAGGFVIGGLLNGHISMSRAIGDDDLKAHRNVTHFPMCARNNRGDKVTFSERLFISEPEVVVTPIQETDVALVIVSDGVWGTLGNERMANIVNTVFENGGCAKDAAKAVVRKAVSKGSRDNATAVVTCLSSFQTQRPLRQQGIAFSSRGTSALNKASSANSNPATQLRPLNNTPVRRKWSLRARSALTGGSTR